MVSNKKHILISNTEIPSTKVGSWNNLLTNLLEIDKRFFDTIISPKPVNLISGVSVFIKEPKNLFQKITSKLYPNYRKKVYWNALNKVMNDSVGIYSISIFDNLKIVKAIDYYAKKNNKRDRIEINFFLRGYTIDQNIENRALIYNSIDKLIVQTYSSYKYQLENNHSIPCEVHVLPNGIDSKIFFPVSFDQKVILRAQKKISKNKKVFLWVSNNRKKKGLFLILKAWQKITEKYTDIVLVIAGVPIGSIIENDSILNVGIKSNKELAPYYQLADYYLFSSLCHEGHPLSLTEAIKSGSKCLVSNISPNKEIIKNGEYGYLVQNPHILDSWINAISAVLENNISFKEIKDLDNIYDFTIWMENLRKILKD